MTRFVGFLRGSNKCGRWIPESTIKADAIAGAATLDFSQALFTKQVININARAFLGGVLLIVPPNVAVEQDGKAILGGFGGRGGVYRTRHGVLPETEVSNSNITIRIRGTAVMGAVTAWLNRNADRARLLTIQEARKILQEQAPDLQDALPPCKKAQAIGAQAAEAARQTARQASMSSQVTRATSSSGISCGSTSTGSSDGSWEPDFGLRHLIVDAAFDQYVSRCSKKNGDGSISGNGSSISRVRL